MFKDMDVFPDPAVIFDPHAVSPPRADLFAAGAWAGGPELVWEDRSVAKVAGRVPAWERGLDPAAALREVMADPVGLDVYAALVGWGTASVEQLRVLTGHPLRCDDQSMWTRLPRPVRRLWAAGLIERGYSISPLGRLPLALRSTPGAAARSLLRGLGHELADRVTSGVGLVSAPTRGDRHNLVATELGCRLAEAGLVEAVVGPSLAGHHRLGPRGRASRAADLLAVRDDTLRIAYEVTCSAPKRYIERKVAHWIELLSSVHEDPGLVVVFVDAADPHRSEPGAVIGPLMRAIAAELEKAPLGLRRVLSDRLAVARWHWWFPGGVQSAEGATQLAYRPSVEGRWQPRHLLDVTDLPFRSGITTGSIERLATLKASASCPATLRGELYRDELDKLVGR